MFNELLLIGYRLLCNIKQRSNNQVISYQCHEQTPREEKLIPFRVDKNNDGDVLFTTKCKVLSI